MRKIFTLLFVLLSLSAYEQGNFNYQKDFKAVLALTKDSTSNLYYNKLLPRFKARDISLSKYETLALLIGFTDQPDYRPYEDIETEKDIFILNDEGHYEEATAQADTYLLYHPVSLRILKEKSYSLHQLKKADSADYYMDLVHKIMSAMLFSGNGKTPETAIFALGLADGERFTENAGMTVGNKGTGENKGGVYMELIDAIKDEGDHLNLFFVIQHARDKENGGDSEWGSDKKSSKKSKKKDKKNDKKEKEQPVKE